jgi:hypothetical protein
MDWKDPSDRGKFRLLFRTGALALGVLGFIVYSAFKEPVLALFNPCRNIISEEDVARVLKKPVGRRTMSKGLGCDVDFWGPGAGSARPRLLSVNVEPGRSDGGYEATVSRIRGYAEVVSAEPALGLPVEATYVRWKDGHREIVLRDGDLGSVWVNLFDASVPRDALDDAARLVVTNFPSVEEFLRGE